MFLFTALVLLLKFNALVIFLFTGLLFTAFTACSHGKVVLMQIRTASMSAMLAITEHGLCLCTRTMFGKFHNGRHGSGTYLHYRLARCHYECINGDFMGL